MNTDVMLGNSAPVAWMSSQEIADLVESRHDSVKRTVERLVDRGVISQPPLVDGPRSGNGVVVQAYRISKRDSYVVVAQLCPEFTARLVDRWQALEAQVMQPSVPRSLPEALRLAADLAEQNNTLRLVVQEQAPQVEALARISAASGTLCLTDAAKHLGVQRKALLEWMQANRWIYRREGAARWLAYQPRLQAGLLEHKVTVLGTEEDGAQRLASQVRVTPRGLTVLAQKLGRAC
ncbi:Phage antirepressor protein YoqD, KilAC domain [Halopseudomonas xinjiangensis]|uniref:Phage antirepressor protein YoqD, KilAC domain n=1 Tax=Halopseudomonas xinjiangensis TaxID=487184 RepID=A0A1H1Q945_9GAMM|nr:phage antirepressor KilAC domain-containing protein [Halopseudomonas xinjiangensis]SDS20041.1 Phage antirepressor protein YoqD, KilAC domain [Halopseudomonas xinjiangensis]